MRMGLLDEPTHTPAAPLHMLPLYHLSQPPVQSPLPPPHSRQQPIPLINFGMKIPKSKDLHWPGLEVLGQEDLPTSRHRCQIVGTVVSAATRRRTADERRGLTGRVQDPRAQRQTGRHGAHLLPEDAAWMDGGVAHARVRDEPHAHAVHDVNPICQGH